MVTIKLHLDAKLCPMRTTVDLEDDVAAAIERIRKEGSIGLSEAVNRLVRAGLMASEGGSAPFVQRSEPMGLKVDVTNVAEALEALEGPSAR